MKEQIEVITYEQDRLDYFTDLMKKAQERYKRLFKKHKDAPYASEEAQALSDAGRETHFLGDVVGMLEVVDANSATPTGEWISVEDRLPAPLDDVLVWDINGNVDTDFVLHTTGKFLRADVTHWMPLPEPPKMKGSE